MLVDFDRLDEQEREELAARGQVHGLSAQQMFACDRLSMDPRRYAAYAGGTKMTLADHEGLRERERVEEQGREDAVREAAKERARGAVS